MICNNCHKEFGNGQYCQYCQIDRVYGGADTNNFGGKNIQLNTRQSNIYCPNCAEIIDSNSTYCSRCGNKIYQNCPKCSHKHLSTHLYCPKCGINASEYKQKQRWREEERMRLEQEEQARIELEQKRCEEERRRLEQEDQARIKLEKEIERMIINQPECYDVYATLSYFQSAYNKKENLLVNIRFYLTIVVLLTIGTIHIFVKPGSSESDIVEYYFYTIFVIPLIFSGIFVLIQKILAFRMESDICLEYNSEGNPVLKSAFPKPSDFYEVCKNYDGLVYGNVYRETRERIIKAYRLNFPTEVADIEKKANLNFELKNSSIVS